MIVAPGGIVGPGGIVTPLGGQAARVAGIVSVGGVQELVALALSGGPAFVEELRRAWDDGNAVAPLDMRLADGPLEAMKEALRPTVLVDESGERHRLAGQPVEEGDALVLVTSGTSGSPKAVVLTHEAVRASALATSSRLGVEPTYDRWLACLPLSHVGGLSVVTRALVTGTALEVQAGFDPEELAQAVRRGATLVSLVPTALRRIDPGDFRTIVLGGSAPPESLPENVVTTYGLTETGSGVVYDGLPLEGVEVSVGESSEVRLRGPMLARRYRDGSSLVGADGWLLTGDAGRIMPDGRLDVMGRLDDVINTGGEKVWPSAVEAVLARHPGIAEVGIAGRPDPYWGERVVAFVVPAEKSCPPSLRELAELVRGELAPWAVPKELVVTESLPRARLGKLKRSALRGAAESA